ncbi:MAG: hypothetical protein IJ512_07960 [Ruminococcus sp.]|nr:hypothetical protein [Ruminococcus sp.]
MAAKKKTAAAEEVKVVETKAAPAAEKKAAEKKTAEKKAAPKRVCKKVSVELQYGEKKIDMNALEGVAVAAWVEATGNAKTAAKNINLYVKPEESMLYYVIEGVEGSVEL